MKLTLSRLERLLMTACDDLRGSMPANIKNTFGIRAGKKMEQKIIQHPALKHVKASVGTMLNKALEAIADHNLDALQDVLKGINLNRKIGQRNLDDDTLSNFLLNFEKIPLKDSDFEFPDLLGAAYERQQ